MHHSHVPMPAFGVVTHAVGDDRMPFHMCLRLLAIAGGTHILLLPSPNGPAIRGDEATESQYPNVLESDPDALRALVQASRLSISALLALPEPDLKTSAAMASTQASYRAYLARARLLGCRSLVIPAPQVEQPGLPLAVKRSALQKLAQLMDAVACGQGDGVITADVDIHYHSLVESIDDARYLVEAFRDPRPGLIINVGHLTTGRQEGWRLIEEYPHRVHAVGWKDHSLAPDRPHPVYSVELGTGDSPLSRYLAACRQYLPERVLHFVNVEDAPSSDKVGALQRSIAYMRKLWLSFDEQADK